VLPLLEPVEPELGLVVPEVDPALPVVSVEPLGLVVVLELPMLLPASAPAARGSVAPERPCGDCPLLVRPPTSLPFLQAPAPTIRAAADAKAISVRVMVFLS